MSSYGIGGMGMFQFGGLASGLDTQKIIQQLVALERRPITLLQNRKALVKTQKQAFDGLDGKLGDLKSSLDALRKATNFLEFTATPGDEGYFTATANSSASQGVWEIHVEQLAQAQRTKSNKYADATTTTFGTGTLTITIDSVDHDFVLGATQGDNTLTGIADAINARGIGVSATVLDTGDPATPYQLVLSSKEPGTDNAFTLSTDDGDLALTNFVSELNGNQFQDAEDAQFSINGIDITRGSNTITDAIPGVTLNLLKPHEIASEKTNLAIATNADAVSEKIQDFVDDYNAVVDFIAAQGKVGEEGKAEGVLVGDFTLNSIKRQLRSIAGGVANTGSPAYSMLAFVGIDSDRDGKLTFDRSEFEDALNEDEAAVKDLFTLKGTGIAALMHDQVDDITDIVDGMIKNRKDGLDRLTRDLDGQIERQNRRVEMFEANLVRKFAGYENLIAMYQAQGYALGGILTGNSNK